MKIIAGVLVFLLVCLVVAVVWAVKAIADPDERPVDPERWWP